jgi:hypothetical protein
MTAASESPLSLGELARLVIEQEKKPLTVDEIWAVAEQNGLVKQLKGTGKTPKATLAARLYTGVKTPDGLFAKVGARPARFVLKSLLKNITQETLEKQLAETPTVTPFEPQKRPAVKLTKNELRRAIVETLEQRGKHSCAKVRLPDAVIKHIKVDVIRRIHLGIHPHYTALPMCHPASPGDEDLRGGRRR